ncbi:mannose-6-phosphate isomerase [Candidatus Nomurabacteria bacterium RIFCSPHIGHO2_02_FULL_42_19]|uniref:Mannose-6-phosphate isomerase n=1 Tax=Candidatus Nomurabacteria bacterium RIFCSPHIGHO2_02_FULL_42_19 TaxID=1801756 RepID=A0A1F6W2I0_9BACT|nr:MAG: mannose-6-phosphate isomerase [Candidatus Nomurabacteria bacterium RIFCSPHIGHO2_02_FULL_42_19]
MSDFKPFTIERPWGNFRQFTHNEPSTVKIIIVNSEEELSLQSHQKRSEFWKVLGGSGMMEIGNKKYEAKVGDEHKVPVGAKHRIKAGSSGVVVLEVSTGDFDESDIIRYEDKYGRT